MGRKKHDAPFMSGPDNLVRHIRRRKHVETSDLALGRKQAEISAMTSRINNDEKEYRDMMVREMEKVISEQSDLAIRVNLQNKLDRFRAGHVDNGVNLEDLSGKIRTEQEAKELMDRLTKHTMQERTDRMRANYSRALRAKGYDKVADYVEGLSDEKFLLGFYFGNNLEMGFEYKIDWDGESTLLTNWKEVERAVRGRSNKRTRARVQETIARVDEALGR